MANEKNQQDELNANDLKSKDGSENCLRISSGNDNSGK